MKAVIESTDCIVDVTVPGVHGTTTVCLARVWEGVTTKGVEFTAYIPIVQVRKGDDNTQFELELREHKQPDISTRRAIDARNL